MRLCDDEDGPIAPPHGSVTVWDDRQPILYLADGTPLVRRAGFSCEGPIDAIDDTCDDADEADPDEELIGLIDADVASAVSADSDIPSDH